MGEIPIPPLNPRKPKRKPQDAVPPEGPPEPQSVPEAVPEAAPEATVEPAPATEEPVAEPVAAAEGEPVAEPTVKEPEEVPEEVLVPVGAGGAIPIPPPARSVLRAASTSSGPSSGPSKGATGMPQYLSPGVYVEEIPSADKPIAGVGTSTAAFIGIYAGPVDVPVPNEKYDPTKPDPLRGRDATGREVDVPNPSFNIERFPPDEVTQADIDAAFQKARDADTAANGEQDVRERAKKRADSGRLSNEATRLAALRDAFSRAAKPGEVKLCTSFADFEKFFGRFSTKPEHNQLAHAVFGFFDNGGTRCFVVHFAADADVDLRVLEHIDEIAIVAAPGLTAPEIQDAVVSHCANLHDRFAILDTEDLGPNEDPTFENIVDKAGNSDFAAIYFPRIKVFDIATKRANPKGDGQIPVPPSGHMAGIYARVDTTRGVHKAPANEVIRGALGLTYPASRAIQDGLNPKGVNCLRDMNGNIKVWGARTLGGDANQDYKYINVRRLMLFIEESIDEGTQWVVFEPNGRPLWAKIRRNVSAFLTNVWRDGALFGSTPQEAFYVKCDDELNPPEVRDLGRVITEIGVAPVRPAEFVIFRITQWTGPGK